MTFIALSSILIMNLTFDAKHILNKIRNIIIYIRKRENWQFWQISMERSQYIYIYICIYICVCVCRYMTYETMEQTLFFGAMA